ncbi:hypothetical protein YBT1518_06670 [Bacillus thuringiensis YBT-1518]|uniref:Uncharacterized protein n=2 Tax=Bacillus thuringiensis TaxID=1428 RepID=A0A9W3S8F8_BACTU|nr:hypothetical protein YBT1518_06670 [Bacillus thuringiensis YBT-1518]ANS46704.1 hypothetical protein BT246_13090 [Bacillus thuringiensis]
MLSKKQVGYVCWFVRAILIPDYELKKVFKDRENSSCVEEFFYVNKRISSNSHNKLVLI